MRRGVAGAAYSFLRALALVFPLVLSLGYARDIPTIASAIAEEIARSGRKAVAVVDFTDLQGNVTELGRFVAEELSVELAKAARGRFQVVDRTHLGAIMREYELTMAGLVNPKALQQLGKVAGVDAIVTGSLTPLGDVVRVTSKAIAVDTAMVVAAFNADLPKTKAIEELIAKGVGTGGPSPAPSSRASQTPTSQPAKEERPKVELGGFVFELVGCQFSGGDLVCGLRVTSQGQDRELVLFGHNTYTEQSRAYDDQGSLYIAQSAWIANIQGKGSVRLLLVADTPTPAGLVFKDVRPEAQMVALLEVYVWLPGGASRVVQFRRIPITRQ